MNLWRAAVRLSGYVSPTANFIGLVVLSTLNIADSNGFVSWGPFQHISQLDVFTLGVVVMSASTVVGLLARVHSGRIERDNSRLRERADRADGALADLRRREIRQLAERFNYYTDERVSLYLHDEGGRFFLVARHSGDPDFDHMSEEPRDDALGCIGHAWAKERDHLVLPSRAANEAGWFAAQKSRGYSKAVAQGFSMSSRTYIAFRVQTTDGVRLGVVLFESEHATDEGAGAGGVVLDPEAILNEMKTEHWGNRLEATLLAARGLRP